MFFDHVHEHLNGMLGANFLLAMHDPRRVIT